MGSGHFVVAMFERLVGLRTAEESLDESEAVASVMSDNLYGLEIDPRCTQIAAFNLALAAWRRVGYCVLPPMNLACSGLAPNTSEEEWLTLAGGNEKLENGMARLYQLFENAPVLGSLINPRAGQADLLEAGFHELQPLLEKALAAETKDDTSHEMAVTARGLAKAAEILAGQFTLIGTNVPYLMRRKQDDALKDFCADADAFPNSKNDLATVFVERGLSFLNWLGSQAMVTPQNWLFLGSYENLRSDFLKSRKFNFVGRLGAKGFRTPMWDFNVALLIMSADAPSEEHQLVGVSVETKEDPSEKATELIHADVTSVTQKSQLRNPGAALTFSAPSEL
jgi:type I restriction-modification system DNA methylase subunit